MNTWIFKENNLDLIRLFAAIQVAILHSFEFMFGGQVNSPFFDMLRLFPGVPIFFFISGYLISKSFERSPNIWEYSRNRVLRIYPALIICVALNLLMVWSTDYLENNPASFSDFAFLFVAKSTIFQFYNPDFMRQFGDGVLNGSLWTVCVELQFYILTPILYTLFSRNKKLSNRTIFILIVLFLAANRLLYFWGETYSESIAWKLYRVSFTPWIYMFITGILFQRNFEKLSRFFSRIPALIILFAYIAIILGLKRFGFSVDNSISPPIFFLLAILILRLSYLAPKHTGRILRGNDISYGIYMAHADSKSNAIFRIQQWNLACC